MVSRGHSGITFRILMILVLLCGIARATSFSGPASLQLGPLSPDPACQSALLFGSTMAVADTMDGYRVTGGLNITSSGLGEDSTCLVYVFFGRYISEPFGTVLTSEGSMSGTLDAGGALQLATSHMDYLTLVSGSNGNGSCFANASVPTPSGGTGVPFSAGSGLAGPCTINVPLPLLQGVITMFLNNQPGTITLNFESLLSEAQVQATPEPSSRSTVFLGLLVVGSGILARQVRGKASPVERLSPRLHSGARPTAPRRDCLIREALKHGHSS